jgi:hypothetical protein
MTSRGYSIIECEQCHKTFKLRRGKHRRRTCSPECALLLSARNQPKEYHATELDQTEIWQRAAVVKALGVARWREFYWYTPEDIAKLEGTPGSWSWTKRNRRNGSNK